MKTYRPWVLAALLAMPVLAPAADDPPASRDSVSREAATPMIDLNELIARVAKRTGKQFIVDPRVRAQIPLTGLDVDRVDYAKLLTILAVNQFSVYPSAGLIAVVPDANSRQFPIPASTQVSASALDEELVTVLLNPKNLCAAQLVPVLRPLMPQSAHMAAATQANTLILVDRAANARRLVDLVERLDKASPTGERCAATGKSDSK